MYQERMKTEKQNKKFVKGFYEEFYNDMRHEIIDEIFSPDYVHHTAEVPGEKMDYEEYREHMFTLARAFPHMKATIDDQMAEGDKVTTRFTIYGIQEGDLPSIPARGKQVKIAVITILKIKDGRIIEGWESYDSLGMAMQLGTVQIISTLGKGQHEKGYFYFSGGHEYNV